MSNEFDTLRKVLVGRAIAVATELGMSDDIQVPNGPPPMSALPDSDASTAPPWINFWYKLGPNSQLAELGGPKALEITPGILQFDILVPEKTGDGAAITLANRIKKKINRKQWLIPPDGYVTLQPAGIVTNLPAKSGWYRVCVDCTFYFYHRDPDADPLQDF